MGFWGSIVVCRGDGLLYESPAVVERNDEMGYHEQRGDWELASFLGTQIEHESQSLLRELALETGAPTLAGHVLDSDTAIIDGYSVQHGHWRTCLLRDSMRAHAEEVGEYFDATYLAPIPAMRAARQWCQVADLTPNLEALQDLLQIRRVPESVEPYVDSFLDAVGVPATEAG